MSFYLYIAILCAKMSSVYRAEIKYLVFYNLFAFGLTNADEKKQVSSEDKKSNKRLLFYTH